MANEAITVTDIPAQLKFPELKVIVYFNISHRRIGTFHIPTTLSSNKRKLLSEYRANVGEKSLTYGIHHLHLPSHTMDDVLLMP